MEVGEGEEHAHLVARESDLIARRDLFSQTGAERARALVERWFLSAVLTASLLACSLSLEIGGAGLPQQFGSA